MSEHILLKYKRIARERYMGELCLHSPEELFLDLFESMSFINMMQLFSQRLRGYPQASAVMQRTDREGLEPHTLDAPTTKLLREDPAAVVRAMTVIVNMPLERPKAPLPPVLPVGQDTLADAFGEHVYCRHRANPRDQIECPCCGRWADTNLFQGFHCCSYCKRVVLTNNIDVRWVSVDVADLLKLDNSKFFLPRAWNEGRNWITHEALKTRYDAYLQEKHAS